MICPQTKAECKNLAFCDMTGKCLEHEADLLTPPPPTLAELVSMREDGSLVIDPSVTSFSAQPSSDGWTMEQVSLSNGDIVECGPLVGKTLVDVPGDAAPFVMRDLTKPTLADIERLAGDVSLALSALMAAIRAYGRE